jgi:hypothetical protein
MPILLLVGAVVVAIAAAAVLGGASSPLGPGGPAGPSADPGTGADRGDPAAGLAPGERPTLEPGPDLGTATSRPADADEIVEGDAGYFPGTTWWVMLAEGSTRADAGALLARFDGDTGQASIAGEIAYLDAYQVVLGEALAADSWEQAAAWLREQPEVAAVAADTLWVAKGCADEMTSGDYAKDGNDGAYKLIGAERAWTAYFASGLPKHYVHVGVVDSPITAEDPSRPYEFNTATFDSAGPATAPPNPTGFHHADGVMGLIAGDRGDGGMVGLASPLGTGLGLTHVDVDTKWTDDPAKTPKDSWYLATDGTTTTFSNALINTIKAVERGATIVNMSFGPTAPDAAHRGQSEMWRRFLAKMEKEHPDVLFVVAAGNEGTVGGTTGHLDGHNYGAAGIKAPNLVTVANVLNDGTLRDTSNTLAPGAPADAEVTLAAPGHEALWGTLPDGTYKNAGGGTSSAAPMVAATAALMRAINPKLSAAEIKEIIARTARSGPADAGGKTLAFDEAVLAVVNKARADAGLPALDDKALAAAAAELCSLSVTGSAVPVDGKADTFSWTVNASLPAMRDPTHVAVTFNGLRPSDWRRPVASTADQVSWSVEVPPAGVAVVATRQDSGYWVRYYLRGGGAAASPAPTAAPTAAPTPVPTQPPAPTSEYDCSDPPPPGSIKYLDWALHCKGIGG